MSRMVECACTQCAEHPGQFKDYQQCGRCGLYGHAEDEFSADPEHYVCNDCVEEQGDKTMKITKVAAMLLFSLTLVGCGSAQPVDRHYVASGTYVAGATSLTVAPAGSELAFTIADGATTLTGNVSSDGVSIVTFQSLSPVSFGYICDAATLTAASFSTGSCQSFRDSGITTAPGTDLFSNLTFVKQ